MIFAIIVTTALVAYQRRVVRMTGSTAIRADSLHYAADILMNVGVIAALALAMTVGWSARRPDHRHRDRGRHHPCGGPGRGGAQSSS